MLWLLYFPVGVSADPAAITMVDSIKVYVKTKEAFGWPEDSEEFPDSSASKVTTSSSNATTPGFVTSETESSTVTQMPLTSLDRSISN